MRLPRRPVWLAAALALAAAVGCQSRLSHEKEYHVESGSTFDVPIDAPRYEQKMTVTVSSDAPMNVYVYLEKDRDAVQTALSRGKKAPELLAFKDQVQNDTLEVTVPAKQAPVVTLETGPKAANAKVKITGK